MSQKLLMCVGAMKAGTTFLYKLLREHPQLYFTPEKELHFLAHMYGLDYASMRPIIDENPELPAPSLGEILSIDFRRSRLAAVMRGRFAHLTDPQEVRDIATWYATKYLRPEVDWDWVREVYGDAEPGQWLCEFSNYNSFATEEAWLAVKARFTEVKVIFVARDPLERLWSHIKFDGRYGIEFESNNVHELLTRYLSDPHICAYGDYSRILSGLKKNFDPMQILEVDFDLLVGHPQQVRCRIEEFLSIYSSPTNTNSELRAANEGVKIKLPEELITLFHGATK